MKIPISHQLAIHSQKSMLKLTSEDSAPPRNEAEIAGHPSWSDGSNPMVHGALRWVGRHKLGDRRAQKGLEDPDENETVNNYLE